MQFGIFIKYTKINDYIFYELKSLKLGVKSKILKKLKKLILIKIIPINNIQLQMGIFMPTK